MRVQRAEHAVNGGLDQLTFVDLLDILGADPFKDVPEKVKLLIDIGVAGGFLRQQRSGHLRGCNHTGQCSANSGHDEFLHCALSILVGSEPRLGVHRVSTLSHFYIERF